MLQTQNQIVQQNENPPPFMAICPPHPSGMDQESLGAMYPILNDYLGLELSILEQNNIDNPSQQIQSKNNVVAIPFQDIPAHVTNGVRKVKNDLFLFVLTSVSIFADFINAKIYFVLFSWCYVKMQKDK